jgi:hypothetical protein
VPGKSITGQVCLSVQATVVPKIKSPGAAVKPFRFDPHNDFSLSDDLVPIFIEQDARSGTAWLMLADVIALQSWHAET